jgi:hypothetical protein
MAGHRKRSKPGLVDVCKQRRTHRRPSALGLNGRSVSVSLDDMAHGNPSARLKYSRQEAVRSSPAFGAGLSSSHRDLALGRGTARHRAFREGGGQ